MEISKQFRIIRQEYKAVLNAGYELDERAERKEDFSDWHLKDDKEARERALRDFGELEDAVLCIDEEDELCAVEFIYSDKLGDFVPMIWQRVVDGRIAQLIKENFGIEYKEPKLSREDTEEHVQRFNERMACHKERVDNKHDIR